MHILTIVGARPQFIKAAVVSRVIRARHGLRESILHTGQHYDANMSDVFFDELDIPRPAIHLGVGSSGHGKQTADMLVGIEKAIFDLKPDWMLIYGDTNSTLAGALAAAKLHLPVAHVEAGLRSFNRRMPEEVNRIVADTLSSLLFPPTQTAVENLAREGMTRGVVKTGDVMYDAALYYGERSAKSSTLLPTLGITAKQYVLCTVHRAENTDDPLRLRGILEGLRRIGTKLPIVLPLHPRTRNILKQQGLAEPSGVAIIDPVSYLDMVALERNAALLVTDSGGVQKEAYFYATPCVTMRDETEWVETVESGWNTLAGADPDRIEAAALRALAVRPPSHPPLYGDGKAGEQIVAALLENSLQ
jgi:UDP-N-acetylglucosamine 2-epimerase